LQSMNCSTVSERPPVLRPARHGRAQHRGVLSCCSAGVRCRNPGCRDWCPRRWLAGVAGPPIGADLLHLAEIEQRAGGMASSGGAGTLEGIVLSGGVVATYDMMSGASLAVCYQRRLEGWSVRGRVENGPQRERDIGRGREWTSQPG
jgi:hypothetical protein